MKLCYDEAIMAPRTEKEGKPMEFWHIETDYFALALFLVMLIKNKRNRQNTGVEYAAFFRVLLMSLFSVS